MSSSRSCSRCAERPPDDAAPAGASAAAGEATAGSTAPPAGLSPRFWRLPAAEPLEEATALDVGTGRGRLALALAPRCRRVVGIDTDTAAVAEARRRAAALGLVNVEFVVADAERVEYREPAPGLHLRPSLVAAHLYLSDGLIDRAGRALAPGGVLAFVGFHADQWRETGRRSRFAHDEDRVRALLEAAGFEVEHLEVEREVTTFASREEALAAVAGLETRWRADGRWAHYVEYLARGGRSLTRSHLIGRGRRR